MLLGIYIQIAGYRHRHKANFHIQNDGAGGALVTDPPVSSSDPTQLALANTHHT
jgi:hypothetical protein